MKKLIYSFLLSLIAISATAQDDSTISVTPKFSFGFSPLAMLLGKARFDFETGFKQNRNPILLSVSPIIYSGSTAMYRDTRSNGPDNERIYNSNDEVSGTGVELQLKITKVVDPRELFMVFAGVGMGYHNINLKFQDYTWNQYQEEGLTYYQYTLGDQSEKIQRFDIFANLGLRTYINRFFYFEASAGFSSQNPTITSSLYQTRRHDNGAIDYGYSGINVRGNIAIGFSLFRK